MKVLSCVSFVVLVLVFAGAGYAKIDPKTAVGIWLFDEGKGNTVRDSSGKGNDGTLKGGVEWTEGKFGKALKFNGTDSYVDTGQQLLEKVPEFTIVLWVQKGKITASRIGLVGQNDTVEFGFIAPTTVQIWSEGAGTNADVNYPYPEGEWHHLAATGTTTSLKNYLDGKMGAQTNINVQHHGSSAFKVNIGGGGVFDGTGNWFTGTIDEVGIFSVALQEDDIKAVMSDGLSKGLGIVAVHPSGKLTATWAGIKR